MKKEYLGEAVVEYLLNIANSNFEPWRRANKNADISKFELQLNKMNVSGAVFDMVKLLDVSKNVISKFTAEKILSETDVSVQKLSFIFLPQSFVKSVGQ